MFSAWGNNMPWGISPFGPSTESLFVEQEVLSIEGTIVEDAPRVATISHNVALSGTITLDVTS